MMTHTNTSLNTKTHQTHFSPHFPQNMPNTSHNSQHHHLLCMIYFWQPLLQGYKNWMKMPSRNETDIIFEQWLIRLWTKPWLNRLRGFLPLFPFLFEDTKEGCYCHLSKGLCICTWPPVPSLWVHCLLQARHIALRPPALWDKAIRCKCLQTPAFQGPIVIK